jgi:hypothetical protein
MKWSFVVVASMALVAFSAPDARAQTVGELQAEVDAAVEELDAATKQAQDNIPQHSAVKKAEDELDAATRANEDTPANAPQEVKDQAQKRQDDAQTRADGLKKQLDERMSDRAGRAQKYRDALRKRREARKKLKELRTKAQQQAGNAQKHGALDLRNEFRDGPFKKAGEAIREAEKTIAQRTQTATALQRSMRQPDGARTIVQVPTGAPTQSQYLQWYVDMTAGAVNRDGNATQFRLAQQVGGLNVPISGVKQNDVGATGQINLSIPLVDTSFGPVPILTTPRQPRYAIDISYAFTQVEGTTSGAGPQTPILALPGLGVQGTNPSSVPAGYLCFGQPYSLAYDYLLRRHLFAVHAQLLTYNVTQHLLVQPLVGARFGHTSVNDDFAYSVPVVGDPVTGNYETKTDVVSAGAVAGFKIWLPFDPLSSPAVRYVFWMSAVGGFDYNRATSDVTFNMRTNTFADTQRVSISDSKVTPYGRVDAGVDVNLADRFKLLLGLYLATGGYAPNVQIPGLNQRPVLRGENELSYGGTAGVRIAL